MRQEIIKATRPILDFLRSVAKEKTRGGRAADFSANCLNRQTSAPLASITKSANLFDAAKTEGTASRPSTGRIGYDKPSKGN